MDFKENTKDQILAASLQLFSENSYHGASIRDIAKKINKRESSIYNHFQSKEEILIEIIDKFGNRNFGTIILTDELINIISRPEKFFIMLGQNVINFWNSDNERMFIKILLNLTSMKELNKYSLQNYLNDFRNLCEFIFKEMIGHKFIRKFDTLLLSQEFLSPLFLFQLELLNGNKNIKDLSSFLKKHVEFFWRGIKR